LALGESVQRMLEQKGLQVVAAPGSRAPGVVVVYTSDAMAVKAFKAAGLQVAAGVKWMIDGQPATPTVRFGLFGLDKVRDARRTLRVLEEAVDKVLEAAAKQSQL
jgi:alanine-glyoxylate transaminase/serine-glyoxylate transaminase/serine-pyruvate transaminase